jgi:predicted nucleic acid-binding protein
VNFLLDTNSVIAILKGHAGVLRRMRQSQPRDLAVSSIVAHELFYGACEGHRTADNPTRIEALRFEILEFDREDAHHAGQLRATLATHAYWTIRRIDCDRPWTDTGHTQCSRVWARPRSPAGGLGDLAATGVRDWHSSIAPAIRAIDRQGVFRCHVLPLGRRTPYHIGAASSERPSCPTSSPH